MNTVIDKPFTEDEEEIMELLMTAHRKFMRLPEQNKTAAAEWLQSTKNMQRILSMRVLRRDYPDYEVQIDKWL